MKKLEKVDRVLNAIRITALVVILAACILMCLVNIILRYVVRGVPSMRPFPWVNELMQMGAVWIAFLAAGLGVKTNAHVSLESFVAKILPAKAAAICKTCISPMRGFTRPFPLGVSTYFMITC